MPGLSIYLPDDLYVKVLREKERREKSMEVSMASVVADIVREYFERRENDGKEE